MIRALILSVGLVCIVSAQYDYGSGYPSYPVNPPSETLPSSTLPAFDDETTTVEVVPEASGEEGSGSDGTIDCNSLPDGLYEISPCATQFYTCSGGINRIMDCPASLIYHAAIGACDYPSEVAGCSSATSTEAPTTTEEPTTTTSTTTTTTTTAAPTIGPIVSCEGAADGMYSFGQCSDSFTACTNGYAVPMTCPASLAFDQARQLCDYPQAVPECNAPSSDAPQPTIEASGEETTTEASGIDAYQPVESTTIGFDEEPSTEADVTEANTDNYRSYEEPTTTEEPVIETTEEVSTDAYINIEETTTPAADEPELTTVEVAEAPTAAPIESYGSYGDVTVTLPASDEPQTSATPVTEAPTAAPTEPEVTEAPTAAPTESYGGYGDVTVTSPAADEPQTSTTSVTEAPTAAPTEAVTVGTTEAYGTTPAADAPTTTEASTTTIAASSETPSTTSAPVIGNPCIEGSVSGLETCAPVFQKCINGAWLNLNCIEGSLFSVADGACVLRTQLPQCNYAY